MLLRFTLANYLSVRDEQELTLIALDDSPDISLIPIPNAKEKALPAVGIYGPNASGKSNILRAIGFVAQAVRNSHQHWQPEHGIPRTPFLLDTASRYRPTRFVVEFVAEGVRYEYGFTCTDEHFEEEWLSSFPQRRERKLFHRQGGVVSFGSSLKERRKLEIVAELARPNSLFLSTATANNLDQFRPVAQWFATRLRGTWINFELLSPEFTVKRYNTTEDRQRILDFLRYADLNVVGINTNKMNIPADEMRTLKAIAEVVGIEFDEVNIPPQIDLLHRTADGDFALPLATESNGTRSWLSLAGGVVQTLGSGGTLVVDELDANLHPTVAAALVDLFQNPETNTTGAQIIFNTHDVTLLGPVGFARLHRDQVWFTERGDDQATRLFPLTEYRVRDGLDNVERKYLNGRFGALPLIHDHITHAFVGAEGHQE